MELLQIIGLVVGGFLVLGLLPRTKGKAGWQDVVNFIIICLYIAFIQIVVHGG